MVIVSFWQMKYSWNDSFISKKLMKTVFYKEEESKALTLLKNQSILTKLQNWYIVPVTTLSEWHWFVMDNGSMSELDFGTSFWTIDRVSYLSMNKDWNAEFTLNIDDTYVFNYRYANGDIIYNPGNVFAKYYQDRGYWTPFEWNLHITKQLNY